MKVIQLRNNPAVYSCNVYLVLGDWNKIEDVNTLIDAGTDGFIIDEIYETSTGVGKKRVEQVIVTHEHFDHAGGLKYIQKEFDPKIISQVHLPQTTVLSKHGMPVKLGDRVGLILHTPGHSNDSICIYCEEEKTLFSGDTPINIRTPGGTYTTRYIDALEYLVSLKIDKIYPGHDIPILENGSVMLKNTLRNVKKSRMIV